MRFGVFAAAMCLTLAWANSATAALLDAFELPQCSASRTIEPERLAAALAIEIEPQLMLVAPLGSAVIDARRRCPEGNCPQTPDLQNLSRLYRSTRTLVLDTTLPANDDFRIVRVQPRPTSAREIDEQVRNLLNADGSPLQVECLRAQADNNQTTPLPLWRRALANLVIGQTSEDAARPFKKREFALFSIEDDRAAERETISIDLFIGLKDQIQFSAGRMEGELVPFLSVQRTSIDQSAPAEGERNDVTFGLTSPLYFFRSGGGLAHTLNVTAEWETDSDFDSSMTALRLAWTPFVRNTCLDWLHVWQSESSLNCGFAVVADYADVADPGEKIDLADVDQYGRVGLDLSFTWDQELTGESVLQFGAGYSFRSSFTDDDDGEADLITASLIFLPSDDSHFSFGIEYRHGEDLSSLDEQQTTMIRFGYRQ